MSTVSPNALQQHTTATHYCNTLLQHTTATHYCNTLLQHTTATHYCIIHRLTKSFFVQAHAMLGITDRAGGHVLHNVLQQCVAVVCCSSVLQ